jgi:hypothetical protein
VEFDMQAKILGSFCDEIQASVAKGKSKEAMKTYPPSKMCLLALD